jgi:hypothetical protein
MIRTRLTLAAALLLAAAPLAGSSHAVMCSPVAADVCATYAFACQRLYAHGINLQACHLQ